MIEKKYIDLEITPGYTVVDNSCGKVDIGFELRWVVVMLLEFADPLFWTTSSANISSRKS